MIRTPFLGRASLAVAFAFLLVPPVRAQSVLAQAVRAQARHVLVEPVPPAEAPVRVAGALVDAPAIRVWKLGCLASSQHVTDAEFRAFVDESRALLARHAPHIAPQGGASALAGGFDLVFTVTSPPPGAVAAVAAIESFYESRLATTHASGSAPIVVQFAPLGTQIAMSTSSTLALLNYDFVRQRLVANMDPDDVLAPFLPAGTLPVRFDALSQNVTSVTDVYLTAAAINSTLPDVNVAGNCATITVNSNVAWDYDPSNGVTPGQACFRTALAHEVGHVLGFDTAVDFGTANPTWMDALRFQRTSGSPQDFAQFQAFSRLVDFDAPNDDHALALVDSTIPMSDGNPFQGSHFREQTPSLGTMDPVLNVGETAFPEFLKSSDLRVLDALGFDWDDPVEAGLAHLPSITRLDEDPSSADSVRWQVAFDHAVGGLQAAHFGLAGVAGAFITALEPVAGSALAFDGTDWIDLQGLPAFVTRGDAPWTVELTFRADPAPIPAPRRQLLAFGTSTTNRGVWIFLNDQNQVEVDLSNVALPTSSPALDDGAWHHVAVRYAPGALHLRIDGAFVDSHAVNVDLGGGSVVVGRSLLGWPQLFGMVGAIDEVRFWTVARTNAELAAYATVPPARTSGFLARFPLDSLGNFGFGTALLPDTPEETLAGGFGEAGTWSGTTPSLVAGRVGRGDAWVLVASTQAASSGVLAPAFTDDDTVRELRSGAPLGGPGASSTSGESYTIVHDSGASFCDGDGCPCGNDAPAGTHVGCLSSLGSGGRLRASGTASIANDSLVLHGSQMPNSSVLYFQGTLPDDGGAGTPLYDGLHCVDGSVVRLGSRANAGGASSWPASGDPSVHARGGVSAPGTRYYQAWYRNAASFCTSATANFTNGWRVEWTP